MEGTSMDEATYKVWWPLHIRAATGDNLTSEERTFYEMWLKRLDEEENLYDYQEEISQMEANLRALEAENAQLHERMMQMAIEIAALEVKRKPIE